MWSLKNSQAELLAGVATAGIAWGAMAADQLKLPYIYVRPKPKEHGLGNQIEGYYEKGQKVVVVEDLVSTGKSSMQVVDVLKEQGLDVAGMVSILLMASRCNGSICESITAILFTYGLSYIDWTGAGEGIVPAEQEAVLLKWQEDPANWTGTN